MSIVVIKASSTSTVLLEQRQIDNLAGAGYELTVVGVSGLSNATVTDAAVTAVVILAGTNSGSVLSAAPILADKTFTKPVVTGNVGCADELGLIAVTASAQTRSQVVTYAGADAIGLPYATATALEFFTVAHPITNGGQAAAAALLVAHPLNFSSNPSHLVLESGASSAQGPVVGARRGFYGAPATAADAVDLLPAFDELMLAVATWVVGPAGPPPDTTDPTVPTGLVVSEITSTAATLTWAPSTDDTAVATYQVKQDGTAVPDAVALTTTGCRFTGLTPGTVYDGLTVSAVDAAGNRSDESTPVAFTTLTAPAVVAAATAVRTSSSATHSIVLPTLGLDGQPWVPDASQRLILAMSCYIATTSAAPAAPPAGYVALGAADKDYGATTYAAAKKPAAGDVGATVTVTLPRSLGRVTLTALVVTAGGDLEDIVVGTVVGNTLSDDLAARARSVTRAPGDTVAVALIGAAGPTDARLVSFAQPTPAWDHLTQAVTASTSGRQHGLMAAARRVTGPVTPETFFPVLVGDPRVQANYASLTLALPAYTAPPKLPLDIIVGTTTGHVRHHNTLHDLEGALPPVAVGDDGYFTDHAALKTWHDALDTANPLPTVTDKPSHEAAHEQLHAWVLNGMPTS